MEIKEIFSKAADLLEKKGWIQHMECSDEGFCLMGAVSEACYQNNIHYLSDDNPYWTIVDLIGVKLGHKMPRYWNDQMDRTKEEVVGLLRELSK